MNKTRSQLIEAMAKGDVEEIRSIRQEQIREYQGKVVFTERNDDQTITFITYPWMNPEAHKPLTVSREEYNHLMLTYDFMDYDMTYMVIRSKEDIENWLIEGFEIKWKEMTDKNWEERDKRYQEYVKSINPDRFEDSEPDKKTVNH